MFTEEKMKIKSERLPLITVAVILLIAVLSLFVLRLGISESGSLKYVLEDIGLYDHQSASGSGYFADSFGIGSKSFGDGTGGLVYGIIKSFLPVDSVIFVYFPAFVYMLMFLAGIYLIAKNTLCENLGNNILVSVLLAIVMADCGYIMYFNTPYTEGSFIAYLTMFLGGFSASAKTGRKRYITLAGIFGSLFGALGIYAAIAGIILSFSFLSLMKNKDVQVKVVTVSMALIMLVSSMYGLTVDKTGGNNSYNRVFYGVLLMTDNDEQALKDLGIDEKYAEYENVPYFDEKAIDFINSEEFAKIEDKLSVYNVLKYYMSHKEEAINALKVSASNGTFIKCGYLGNYTSATGKAGAQTSFWSLYNIIKPKVIPASLTTLLVILLAVFVLSLSFKNKFSSEGQANSMGVLIALLALASIAVIPVAVLINGISQIDLNMLSFNFLFDCTLIGAVTGGIRVMWVRQNTLRKKYGVNQ